MRPLSRRRALQLGGLGGRRRHDGSSDLAEPRQRPSPRSTVVRIPFETNAGRSVYHCHILDHEDNGMMGVIEVI